MSISQKCQYALRALLELAKRQGQGPVNVGQISAAQMIPERFLELILGQLRQEGYVESRRGVQGGYMLATDPAELTVGNVIRFVDGPLSPVKCIAPENAMNCPMLGRCAFTGLWQRAKDAVSEVYDSTTFQDLIEQEQSARMTADYCI